MVMTRGVRNNNPFNIKRSQITWRGESMCLNDRKFEEFVSMDLGLRAGLLLLRNYITRGYDTPRKIICRFAPASDGNRVHDYLSFVASCPLNPDSPLRYKTDNFYLFVQRMLWFESLYKVTVEKLSEIVQVYKL